MTKNKQKKTQIQPVKFEDVKRHRREINQDDEDTRQKKGGNERIVDSHIQPIGIFIIFDMFA